MLKSRPQFQKLCVNNCCNISDDMLYYISKHCVHITCLEVENNISITNTAINTVIQNCTLLNTLNLSGCEQLTVSVLRTISQCAGRLRSLYVSNCSQLSRQDVAEFLISSSGGELIVFECNDIVIMN